MILFTDFGPLTNDREDLSWLFDLPADVLVLEEKYDCVVLLGEIVIDLHEIGNYSTEMVIDIIRKDEALMNEIKRIKKDIVITHQEAQRLYNVHKKLFRSYGIVDIDFVITGYGSVDDGKDLYCAMTFESFTDELLFGYYFRTRINSGNQDKLIPLLEKLINGGDKELDKFKEWKYITNLFASRGCNFDWHKYIKITKNRLILKGNGWLRLKNGFGSKFVELCKPTEDKNFLGIEYNGKEELETLLSLIED